jgi:hypothetical protein
MFLLFRSLSSTTAYYILIIKLYSDLMEGEVMQTKGPLSSKKRGMLTNNFLGCPLTNNRSLWCFRICTPNASGNGFCGRVAPHGLKSKIQICIENYNKRSTIE